MGTNVMSGIGAAVDAARQGMRVIDRVFAESPSLETKQHPLAPGTPLRALRQGELCSMVADGSVGPFDQHQPFAGLVLRLVDNGTPQVVVHSRGAVLLTVEGLRAESVGERVHALAPNRFGLDGGAEVGQIIAIENLERGWPLWRSSVPMIPDHSVSRGS